VKYEPSSNGGGVTATAKGKSWFVVGQTLDKLYYLIEVDFRGINHRNHFIRVADTEPYRRLNLYRTFKRVIE
jgi:hypothetical protein